MILHLAVLVEHQLVTDRQTDRHTMTANTHTCKCRAGKNNIRKTATNMQVSICGPAHH